MGMCNGKNALLFCHKDNTTPVLNPSPFWIIQVGLLLCALSVKPVNARWFTTEPYKDIVTNYVWSRIEMSYTGCTRRNLPYCRRTFISVHRYNQTYTKMCGYDTKNAVFLRFHVLYLLNTMRHPYTAQISLSANSQATRRQRTWKPWGRFLWNQHEVL
jgi:hypothetical protein